MVEFDCGKIARFGNDSLMSEDVVEVIHSLYELIEINDRHHYGEIKGRVVWRCKHLYDSFGYSWLPGSGNIVDISFWSDQWLRVGKILK